MNKRNITIISLVFIAVITIFLVKGLNSKNTEINSANLKKQYEQITGRKKPTIIVFSYDAECCPTTEQFFFQYNTKAKILLDDYKDKFETLYIDTGAMQTEEQQKELLKIADENKVLQLPTLVIKDSKGTIVKSIEGPFESSEVAKVLDEVIK